MWYAVSFPAFVMISALLLERYERRCDIDAPRRRSRRRRQTWDSANSLSASAWSSGPALSGVPVSNGGRGSYSTASCNAWAVRSSASSEAS